MRKIIAILLTVIITLGMVGCSNVITPGQDGSKQPIDGWETTVSYANWSDDSSIFLGALNKEKMTISSVKHLPIFKIDTKQDFEQFKSSYGETLSMNQGYDEIPSFEEATSKYDEAFFKVNSLLIVYVEANSGSLRYGVSEINNDMESFTIHVKQTNNPENVTDDMAGWFITVAVQDSTIRDCESFDADLNNAN